MSQLSVHLLILSFVLRVLVLSTQLLSLSFLPLPLFMCLVLRNNKNTHITLLKIFFLYLSHGNERQVGDSVDKVTETLTY